MSRTFTPDETLVDLLVQNDTDAFEELHHRYCYSLYKYCISKLNSPEDARQIVRDIFIRLWENRQSLPVDFSISVHLYHEVRREVVNCVNEKLNNQMDIPTVEEFIIPGFAAINLRDSKKPVITKPTAEQLKKKKNVEQPWWNYYPSTVRLKQVRVALNRVLHLF